MLDKLIPEEKWKKKLLVITFITIYPAVLSLMLHKFFDIYIGWHFFRIKQFLTEDFILLPFYIAAFMIYFFPAFLALKSICESIKKLVIISIIYFIIIIPFSLILYFILGCALIGPCEYL